MPLPFVIPFVPVLKLLALGSIKFILIFVGALIAPKFTLRFLLGGAAGIALPVAKWLHSNQNMDTRELEHVEHAFEILNTTEYSAADARDILFGLTKHTASQMKTAVLLVPARTVRFFKRLTGRT